MCNHYGLLTLELTVVYIQPHMQMQLYIITCFHSCLLHPRHPGDQLPSLHPSQPSTPETIHTKTQISKAFFFCCHIPLLFWYFSSPKTGLWWSSGSPVLLTSGASFLSLLLSHFRSLVLSVLILRWLWKKLWKDWEARKLRRRSLSFSRTPCALWSCFCPFLHSSTSHPPHPISQG